MEHRKNQFKIFGVAPEIQKLDFNRYFMVFRCELGEKTAWYYENQGEFWADFATLSTSPLGEPDQESEAIPGEDYANMRMTSQELKDGPIVEFTYQTLTDTFVQETADQVDYEMNNLRRVQRSVIAKDGTAYTKEVGTAELIHNEHGQGSKTLYLAQVDEYQKKSNEGGFVRYLETWLESGQIFKRESNPDDGIKRLVTGWWHTVGDLIGPIISKDTENFLGFNIITVTTITAPDGTDITDGNDDKKVADYETLVPWTRAGILAIKEEQRLTNNLSTIVDTWQKAPVQMNIRAHVEIYFSKSGDISDADFDDITGGTDVALWNPDEWVTLEGAGQGSADASSLNRTYRGFRAVDPTDNIYNIAPVDGEDGEDEEEYTYYSKTGSAKTGKPAQSALSYGAGWFGKFYSYPANDDGDVVAIATLVGGPPKPEGKIWMIDVQSTKAFTDIDGVDYYKNTYVWSYIPDFENGEDIWVDAP